MLFTELLKDEFKSGYSEGERIGYDKGETQEIQTEDAVVSVYSDAASAGENVVPGDGSSSSSTAFFIFAIVIGIGVLAALVVVLLRKNRK